VPHPVVLELLRRRALLVDVVALALAVPAATASIADLPAGAIECRGSSPSWRRKPPTIVAMSGE
jgi:hypothetical protein